MTGSAHDVVVIGGGNAALCAAISARLTGARVLLLERSTETDRGGNSKYTRNIRCARKGPSADATYSPEELLSDLATVGGDGFDPKLATLAVERSQEAPAWMEAQGIRWQGAFRGTLQLSRTNRFFLGGGKALLNRYYQRAAELGVEVRYETRVVAIDTEGERIVALRVETPHGPAVLPVQAAVAASGGFESNLEWLRRYWGDAVDNYAIRGTAANDGQVLAALLEAGAEPRGNPRGFHAIAVDARSPRFDGGIVTRVDSIPFGITLNRLGERFYDEGEEVWPKRYATWGGLIAQQPDQRAFSIFDSKAWGLFIPCAYPPHKAGSIEELAGQAGLPVDATVRTVENYNRAAAGGERYQMERLDGKSTSGLELPKSNWALRIDKPPFYAFSLRPGITFTYMGVGVDERARVVRSSGGVFENLFAAGEIMSGNILLRGYLAGFGMTIGTVFGRLAGSEAARAVGA